jgi:dye decolorizing peroxidase
VTGTAPRFTRRGALAVGAALVGGAAAGAAVTRATDVMPVPDERTFGADLIAFHGRHQAGVETAQQAHAWFVGLDLRPGVDPDAAARLMRIWTDDAERLTGGRPALADLEAELATSPARLTITLGLGLGFFRTLALEAQAPASLGPLPSFPIDRFDGRWPQTDLLLQVASDDLVTVSHAVRVLTRDARSLTRVVWIQRGFVPARGTKPSGTTSRNLLGQVDGTVNPVPGTSDFADVVWADQGPEWFRDGTMLVLRRIRMGLDTWEKMARDGREFVIGRRLDDGAPITGGTERSAIDFDAEDAVGLPAVDDNAHVRLAHARNPDERLLRRGYSYDASPGLDSVSDVGLLFCAYAADLDRQYLPIQRRLAASDMLNLWTTPVGSATYAIPPGAAPGQIWCQGLLAP